MAHGRHYKNTNRYTVTAPAYEISLPNLICT